MMPQALTIALLLLVMGVGVAAAMVWVRRQRRGEGGGGAVTPSAAGAGGRGRQPGDLIERDSGPQVLALPTDRPNEIYVFGPIEELDRVGSTLASAPRQLARYASGLQAGVDTARSSLELSGRLVLVDEKTAAAIRAGTMMRDKAGEMLALTTRADKKIASVTRIRQVGGLATSAATLTSALSAMAMQAQLDRIERQLSALSEGVENVNREILREWQAQTLGAQDVLMEVYATATKTGELTPSNWSQIASIGHVVRTQINGDRDRLKAAVVQLERLAAAPDVKQRRNELGTKVADVLNAHAALSQSTRTWAQYSALRLWHFTVSGDPTLEAYQEELQAFMAGSRQELEPLRARTLDALRAIAQHGWKSAVRHPFVVRQLPAATQDRLADLEHVRWRPLELEPPTADGELVASGDSTELETTGSVLDGADTDEGSP
jgi:hypothetical protein